MAATLCDEITDEHLEKWETTWEPVMEAHCAGLPPNAEPEDSGWNWKANALVWRGDKKYDSFAIVCEGELQGMMVTNKILSGRLPKPKGPLMVYVELLATAPWNRPEIQEPRYRSTGWMLMLAAIELSRKLGFGGRIGLHSLSQAREFYRDRCGMTDLGMEVKKRMHYFEMTEPQAEAFRQKTKKP